MRLAGLTLTLAASAMAISQECFVNHAQDVSEYADCGDSALLTECFATKLSSSSDAEFLTSLRACYTSAGCSDTQASSEAEYAIQQCTELTRLGELRKRYPAIADMPARTAPALLPRSTGADCFTTSEVDTSTCQLITEGSKTRTGECSPAKAQESECKPNLFCTRDTSGTDVCMDRHDSLDTGGVIVSIVFAVAIVIGIGALTFLCCRERRQHKRMAAKAEATALARAATKKQRSADARAPLMRQQDGPGADPFHDQHQQQA